MPDELAPEVQKAIENGRQLQDLMKEAGLRYVKARKRGGKRRRKSSRIAGAGRYSETLRSATGASIAP